MNFNTKAVSTILGLSRRRLDYWDSSHLIKPSVREASGYGSVRLYSFNDLIQLRVAKMLRNEGISLQKIRKALNYLKKNMPEVENPLGELKFLTDGKTIFVLTKDSKKIIDILRSGQLVFTIALGDIVEELKGEIRTLRKERKYTVTVKGKNYRVVLHPYTEGGGYWIVCPSLPGCASQGETVEEALEMMRKAIEGHLRVIAKTKKARRVISNLRID